ncbi:MAG: hypothetical protein QOK37_174 [Thermoanaerobaculia bacterium]|jgi:hypothetical protein|nr:hypothetical protein [Thermoanaerobaculia bacterium]
MVDAQGRPYFLWDVDMTLDELKRLLREGDPATRAYLTGKMMRQAKPDDALQFVSPQEIADRWPSLEKYLGKTHAFWSWLIEEWKRNGMVRG